MNLFSATIPYVFHNIRDGVNNRLSGTLFIGSVDSDTPLAPLIALVNPANTLDLCIDFDNESGETANNSLEIPSGRYNSTELARAIIDTIRDKIITFIETYRAGFLDTAQIGSLYAVREDLSEVVGGIDTSGQFFIDTSAVLRRGKSGGGIGGSADGTTAPFMSDIVGLDGTTYTNAIHYPFALRLNFFNQYPINSSTIGTDLDYFWKSGTQFEFSPAETLGYNIYDLSGGEVLRFPIASADSARYNYLYSSNYTRVGVDSANPIQKPLIVATQPRRAQVNNGATAVSNSGYVPQLSRATSILPLVANGLEIPFWRLVEEFGFWNKTHSDFVANINANIEGLYIKSNISNNKVGTNTFGGYDPLTQVGISQSGSFSNILARIPIVENGGIITTEPSDNSLYSHILDTDSVHTIEIKLTDTKGRVIDLNGTNFILGIQFNLQDSEGKDIRRNRITPEVLKQVF
tara:strand:+ start:12315 stop:13700 length:1386 start_codon:yes stop_codon:yes gene_type:complete